jgi:hypothetical protein
MSNTQAQATPITSGPSPRFQEYKDQLTKYSDQSITVQRDHDKWLLTIAGGAIALSIPFAKGLAETGVAEYPYVLVAGWAGFGVAILFTLLNLHLGVQAFQRFEGAMHTACDEHGVEAKEFWPRVKELQSEVWQANWDVRLRLLSLAGLVAGVVFLLVFVFLNVSAKGSTNVGQITRTTEIVTTTTTTETERSEGSERKHGKRAKEPRP